MRLAAGRERLGIERGKMKYETKKWAEQKLSCRKTEREKKIYIERDRQTAVTGNDKVRKSQEKLTEM